MVGRIFLIFLTICSLIWIAYSSLELVEKDKQFTPEYLFGKNDGSLLIVHDAKNLNRILPYFETTQELTTLTQRIHSEFNGTVYISAKRNQLLFVAKNAFTKEKVKQLFTSSSDLQFTQAHSFKIGNFSGKMYRNYCHLSTAPIVAKAEKSEFTVDINSNGAIVDFLENGSVRDLYLKESGMSEFKTKLSEQLNGSKVNDRDLFGTVVSAGVSSYEFYEVDYLRHVDPAFYSGPMNEWVKTGVVLINYKGSPAVITDYRDGQDPIQNLFDHFQRTPETVESAKFPPATLCSFLSVPSGFYVYNMDDFVVLSPNAATCEALIADYKLGNTIVHSELRSAEIFGLLPQKVNHRMINSSIKQASSVYNDYLLTTTVGNVSILRDDAEVVESTTSYASDGPIVDFFPMTSKELFLLSKNKVVFFREAQKKWEQSITGTIQGKAQLIDLFANGNQQLLIATESRLYLFDSNGQSVNGFPVTFEDYRCTEQPVYYRWKGNGFFLVPVDGGKLLEIDTKGRELNVIKSRFTDFKTPPVVWVSANQPFVGVSDGNQFEMIQAQTKKSFRHFTTKGFLHSAVLPNELVLFGIDNQQLQAIDQKGNLIPYGSVEKGQFIAVYQQSANPTLVTRSSNTLKLFNSKGVEWASLRVPFNEIDRVDVHSLENGSIVLSVIDGLENNVYLYKTNGQKVGSDKWEGSGKVVVTQGKNGKLSLYTIVDNMVVRYIEN